MPSSLSEPSLASSATPSGNSGISNAPKWLIGLLAGRHGRVRQIVGWSLIGLALLRMLLPYAITALVNRQLAQGETVQGSIGGVSLGILSASYAIHELRLEHGGAAGEAAHQRLLEVPELHCQLHLGALFRGCLEGDLRIDQPTWHVGPDDIAGGGAVSTRALAEAWRKAVSQLIYIRVASLHINDGHIAYRDERKQIVAEIHDISGGMDDLILPAGSAQRSQVHFTAKTMGSGVFRLDGSVLPDPDHPRADIKAALEHVALPELNEITTHYDGLTFSSGIFSGYAELTLDRQHLHGYFKPVFVHLEVKSYKTKHGNAATKIFWGLVVPVAEFVLRNSEKDQHAAKIPIDGNIADPHADLWSTLGSALSNAFINAIIPGYDGVAPPAK